MSLKTYEDGSELTVGMLAVGIVAGALGGLGLFWLSEQKNRLQTKRIMKKYGWPQEAIDRL